MRQLRPVDVGKSAVFGLRQTWKDYFDKKICRYNKE
jgi:hypothetical protein